MSRISKTAPGSMKQTSGYKSPRRLLLHSSIVFILAFSFYLNEPASFAIESSEGALSAAEVRSIFDDYDATPENAKPAAAEAILDRILYYSQKGPELKADQLFVPLEGRLKKLTTLTAKIEADLYTLFQQQANPVRAARAMGLTFERYEKTVKTSNNELTQQRQYYCAVLQAAGDYVEEQRQMEKLMAEKRKIQGPISSDPLEELTSYMVVCKKAGMNDKFLALVPQLQSILRRRQSNCDTLWSLPYQLALNLAEDKHYDQAYALTVSCIDATGKKDLDSANEISYGDFDFLPDFFEKQKRQAQSELLWEYWIKRMQNIGGPNSRLAEQACLAYCDHLIHWKRFDQATKLLERAAVMSVNHPAQSQPQEYNSKLGEIANHQEEALAATELEKLIPVITQGHPEDKLDLLCTLAELNHKINNEDKANMILREIEQKTIATMVLRHEKMDSEEFGAYVHDGMNDVYSDHDYSSLRAYLRDLRAYTDRQSAECVFADWFFIHRDYRKASPFYKHIAELNDKRKTTNESYKASILKSYAKCLEMQGLGTLAKPLKERAIRLELASGAVDTKVASGPLPTLNDFFGGTIGRLNAGIRNAWLQNGDHTGYNAEVVFKLQGSGEISDLAMRSSSGPAAVDTLACKIIQNLEPKVRMDNIGPRTMPLYNPVSACDFKCIFAGNDIKCSVISLAGTSKVFDPGTNPAWRNYYNDMLELLKPIGVATPEDGTNADENAIHSILFIVQFDIDRDGGVSNISVLRSRGSSRLDQASVDKLAKTQPLDRLPPAAPDKITVQYYDLLGAFNGAGNPWGYVDITP